MLKVLVIAAGLVFGGQFANGSCPEHSNCCHGNKCCDHNSVVTNNVVATQGVSSVIVNANSVDFVKMENGKIFLKIRAVRGKVKTWRGQNGHVKKHKQVTSCKGGKCVR